MNLITSKKYRTEIDGLRAFSVLAVVIFHFGFIKNGYLGVDVFFVISGFLITGNIYNKILNDNFSILDFYIRRTKRFGVNNGYFYNFKGDNYCKQKTGVQEKYLEENNIYRKEWGDKFINLIDLVIDEEKKVPVFTNECKFISQDCLHLTKPGAKYFSTLLENDEDFILNKYILNSLKNLNSEN